MNYGIWPVEIRQRGRELFGSFPYGRLATIGSRGSLRKERIDAGAFDFAIEDETREIHLLVDHSYGKPVARKLNGTLALENSSKALTFRTTLPPEDEQQSWIRDTVLSLRQGNVGGISPGFTVPPANVIPGAEILEDEPGNPGVQIRVIRAAVLFELSLVTRPAYKESIAELRAEDFGLPPVTALEPDPYEAYRWL